MASSRTGVGVELGRPIVLIPPTAAYLVCSTLVVAAAAWLGADWLRDASVGLPAGVWIILLGTVLTAFVNRERETPENTEAVVGAPRLAWRRTARRVLELPALVARRLGASEDHLRRLADRWASRLDRAGLAGGPIRVGVGLPAEDRAALTRAPGDRAITWVQVSRAGDDQADCRDLGLDAVVRRGEFGPMRVTGAVSADRDAAWYDWSRPRPLSYSGVFPGRVDPEMVTLVGGEHLEAGDAPALRRLVESVAELSRATPRITLGDRLLGRGPGPESGRPSASDAALLALGERIERNDGSPESITRPIARAVGAWLASTPTPIDLPTRRRGVEAAGELLGDEPEALLRLAAVRVATGDDAGAFDAIVRADRVIRATHPAPISDHFSFLEAELRLPEPDALQLGRVAAGIALVCAGAPSDHLAPLSEDIAEDLGFTEWLVGRDQDRALLLEVFRVIERGRERELRAAA